MTDRDLDPRFDPRYQRGFDPALDADRDDRDARRSSLSRPAHVVPPPRQQRHPEPQPATSNAVVPAAGPGLAPGLGDLDRRSVDAPELDEDGVDSLEPHARNPYRLALLVGSLAALLGGVAALWVTATAQNDVYARQDTTGIFLLSVANALAPALISAALIGVVIWIGLGVVLSPNPRDD